VASASPHRHAGTLELVDRWIFSRASRVSAEVNAALEQFRFHEAAHVVYHFFWGEFCDWYIEWVKPRLDSPDRDVARTAWRNLFAVFHTALRLLHPFMPFLTEELWHRLPRRPGIRSIAFDRFPEPREVWQYEQAEKQMALIQKIIGDAREIRADLKLDPKKKVAAEISSTDSSVRALVEAHREPILRLAMLSELQIGSGHLSPKGGAIRSTAQFDLRIPYGKAIDVRAEVVRLRKEMEKLARDLESKQNRLADEAFRSRAPEEIVRSLELTLRERQVEYKKLVERLAQLESDLGASSAG